MIETVWLGMAYETKVAVPFRKVKLPDGYKRVWSGFARVGDMYLSMEQLCATRKIEWTKITFDFLVAIQEVMDNPMADLTTRLRHYNLGRAEFYGCLIRETSLPRIGEPCPCCGVRPPVPGEVDVETLCAYCEKNKEK